VADEHSVMDTDMLSIDSIYYPGVFQCIEGNLKRTQKSAFVIMNLYDTAKGQYHFYDNEGSFEVFQEGSSMHVTVSPNGNDSAYSHALNNFGF
jgi:hypothetical protein